MTANANDQQSAVDTPPLDVAARRRPRGLQWIEHCAPRQQGPRGSQTPETIATIAPKTYANANNAGTQIST